MRKLINITAPEHRCDISVSCPAVYRSEDGKTFTIIGTKVVSQIRDKAGAGEEVIEIPAEILLASLGIDGPWTPDMRRAAMKDAQNICDLIEAANSFIGEIEDTPRHSCREIQGLTSFNVLRNLVNRIQGGDNG